MPYFDKFDICEAYWCYASDWHSGQWSKIYEIFGRLDRMGFKPSPMLSTDSLEENAREIYDLLVEKKHLQ